MVLSRVPGTVPGPPGRELAVSPLSALACVSHVEATGHTHVALYSQIKTHSSVTQAPPQLSGTCDIYSANY